MNIEALEEMEREHEKVLLALEQEIEGWKAANRILKAHLEQAEKALERAKDYLESGLHYGPAEAIEEALQAIRK